MRRVVVPLVILCILAIAGALAWGRYGGQLYTKYVLLRCDRAWRGVRDVQAQATVQYMSHALGFTISGHARFKRPDALRLELDQMIKTELIGRGDKVWVYWPLLKTAIEVVFEKGSPLVENLRGRKADQWVKNLATNPRTRVVGKPLVSGRRCYLIDVPAAPATPEAKPSGRTLLYLDTRTLMPAQVVVSEGTGPPVLTVSLKDIKVNRGLPDSDFELGRPKGLLVVRRVFNPAHPESLLLPPLHGKEKKAPTWDQWLNKMNDELDRALPRGEVSPPGGRG